MAVRARAARDDSPCRDHPAARLAQVPSEGAGGRRGRPDCRAHRRTMRFWDSSALVPLVVTQPTSSVTDAWLAADPVPAVWTLTPVEISSAIQRLLRDGAITDSVAEEAERRAADLVKACHVVIDVETAKSQAQRLLRLHALRAADALQLGAALEWCGGRASGRILHTLDARLAAAARREGFAVLPAEK